MAADFVGDISIAIASGTSMSLYDQRYIGIVHNARNSGAVYVCKGDSGESEIQAISTRGDFVAFVDDGGRLGVFDITDPEMLTGKSARFSNDGHDAMAACVCFHPEEPVVATGAFDQQVCVWDVASEKVIRRSVARPIVESTRHAGADAQGATTSNMVNPPFVYALDFVPGFAAADDVPNTEDHEQWMVVSGHADGRIIRFMQSHPEILATAGLDRTIKLWNSDSIIAPDNIDGDDEDNAAVVRDSLPLAAYIDLAAKPDTLATSEEAPVIYTDENNSVVAFAIV
ncbi:hypothetical protein GGI23_005992 [Coemansia sp. RSA 2559]|nr:hypothetical protein GGI23_005992 [Coemansia sp. RSA 2559]KAJ2847994.1 hypothetical protein GGI22_005831 [Coemansia erecta]